MSRPNKKPSGKKTSIYQILVNIKNPTGDLVKAQEDGKPSESLQINSTPLTLDILVLPSGMSREGLAQYPYMIEHQRIPSDKLFGMLRTGYDNVVQFFFNKKWFMNTMGADTVLIDKRDAIDGTILEDNVKLMLELLFPTIYPVPRNNFNSYGHYITHKDTSVYVKGQFADTILGTPTYTYIQLGGSKYTVTRTVWLNDVYNNPVYRVLINDYTEFVEWLSEAKPRVVIEIRTLINSALKSKAWQIMFGGASITKDKFDEFYDIVDKSIKTTFRGVSKINTLDQIKNVFLQQLLEVLSTNLNNYKSQKGSMNLNDYIERINYLSEMFNKVEELTTKYPATNDVIKEYTAEKITEIEEREGEPTSENFLQKSEIMGFLIAMIELKQAYDKTMQASSGRSIFTAELTELMNLLSGVLMKITLARKVYETYLLPKKYIIEETDENIRSELQRKYDTLVDYGKRVQNLKQYVSTNAALQQAVNGYINADDTNKRFEKILESIQTAIRNNKLIKDVVHDKKILNTGVGRINPNKKESPQYEIYVGMDLIKGELKHEDVKKIKCAYEGFYLGQQLSLWSIASNNIDYIVVDLEELMKKSKKKEDEAPASNKTGGDVPNMGGSRDRNTNHRLTRRQYFAFARKTHRR
jgi:hypothetical protein